jgi:acyl-coenzyme A thioesterase PaaI-like protein
MHHGKTHATAQATLRDDSGKLYGHATTGCAICAIAGPEERAP